MEPPQPRRAPAAPRAAGAIALALIASPVAAQTATSVALPSFSYFGSALVSHELSPSAREAELIGQMQVQQLYRSLSDTHGLPVPSQPPRCAQPTDAPPAAAEPKGAPPACIPSPSETEVSEDVLQELKASPAP